MGIDIFFLAVILLASLAIFDLIVGVSNDAVNFLNSPIGCHVAPRTIIFLVASLGILAGVTFSGGMMEVARKGIFHPEFFTMPELLTLFLAVMLTDVILLDSFSSRGMPTSTTVSVVFELLGAAVAVSALKIISNGGDLASLAKYINTGRAILMIFAILLSVIIAFVFGALVQVLTRLIFTFDYTSRLRRYGAFWCGAAVAAITYFILIKGAKGTSFMTPETVGWIKTHTLTILLASFAASVTVLQIMLFLSLNILKPIILLGTFALAMAFAANDLVNFIGVPMAGYHAYKAAAAATNPLEITMGVLGGKMAANSSFLLVAGAIMVITICVSRKTHTVIKTGVDLSQQSEGEESFDSTVLSRMVVRTFIRTFNSVAKLVPLPLRQKLAERLNPEEYTPEVLPENRPAFDLLRAAVNLVVASALISYATSYKLPLSTTYVTFMVAMGTSFADQAWGRESAVYRITGVLTVIGGWFLTAFAAFTISCIFAAIIFYIGPYGVGLLLALCVLVIWNNHRYYTTRNRIDKNETVFNLAKITDVSQATAITFQHMAFLVGEIRQSLNRNFTGLFTQNEFILRAERRKIKDMQHWGNIIAANVFKTMRLLQEGNMQVSPGYGQTIRRIQKMIDGHRDIVMRSFMHVSNHHQGLLASQIDELKKINLLSEQIITDTEAILSSKQDIGDLTQVKSNDKKMREISENMEKDQVVRIQDGTSKTRLSILFHAILGNNVMLCRQNLRLLEIFGTTFGTVSKSEYDLD